MRPKRLGKGLFGLVQHRADYQCHDILCLIPPSIAWIYLWLVSGLDWRPVYRRIAGLCPADVFPVLLVLLIRWLCTGKKPPPDNARARAFEEGYSATWLPPGGGLADLRRSSGSPPIGRGAWPFAVL